MKDLYSENYKTLKKEIEEDTSKWKHILCSWIGRINIIKMPRLPKEIPIKIPKTYFIELKQNFKNLYGTTNGPTVILRKKNKVGESYYLISNYNIRP